MKKLAPLPQDWEKFVGKLLCILSIKSVVRRKSQKAQFEPGIRESGSEFWYCHETTLVPSDHTQSSRAVIPLAS